jgi:hypothetical protein
MLTKNRVEQVVRDRAELIDCVPGDAHFHKGYVAAFVAAAMEADVITAREASTLCARVAIQTHGPTTYRKAGVHA